MIHLLACPASQTHNFPTRTSEVCFKVLEKAPWDCTFLFDDINDIVDTWYKIFKAVVNKHLPLKQNRVKCRNQPKWFNVNILKEIRKRDNSLKKARKSNLERDWDLYKQEKNSVSSLIRRRKQAYYKNKISENKINTRKLWNLIKSLPCDDDESQSSIEKLIDSGNVITDKTSTVEL